jgi:iron complex outermembrane recepter protein
MYTQSQRSNRWLLPAIAVLIVANDRLAVAAEAAGGGLQEVVVTAQRRPEDLQTVPVSVTAISGEALEQLQISTTAQLSQFTPSLHIYSEDIGSEFYTIRGIGRTSEDLSADPGVAVFLNGGYLARQAVANLGLFDVQQVEVLRGPQGTLFGKNATAGAINITTKAPTDTLSGYADVLAGNYSRINGDGAVSGPLAAGITGRLAFVSENRDGLYHNITTGDTANNIDRQGVRGTLRFTPADRLSVDVILDYQRYAQHGALKSIFADVPGTLYEFFLHNPFTGQPRPGITPQTEGPDPFFVADGTHGGQGLQTYGGVVNVRYQLASFDFISTTMYRHETDYSLEDNGRTPEVASYSSSNEDTASVSQEFRLVSNLPNRPGDANRWSWTVGAYYFHEQGSKLAGILYDVVPFSGITYWDQSIYTNSLAAFADVRYRLLDRLSATAGIRYTTETKNFTVNAFSIPVAGEAGSDGSTPFLDNGNFLTHSSDRWNKVSPRFVLDYQFTDDLFTYASYSEGFKSGGFDGEPPAPPLTEFAPENVKNYEVGFKGEFLERLRTNLSVFYSDYTNLQLQTFSANGTPITGTADALSRGVELEVLAQVTSALSVSAGASFINPTYKHYISQLPAVGTLFDRSGDTIGEVPKRQEFVLASYKIPLGRYGLLDIQPDVVYVGQTITEFGSLWSPAYTKGDLRIIWNAPDAHWSASVWAKNITNVVYYEGGGPVSKYNTDIVRVGPITDPRTYGVSARYQF